MRATLSTMLAIPAMLAPTMLAACGAPSAPAANEAVANSAAPLATPAPSPSPAPPPAARASKVAEKTDDFTFTYAYPAQAAAIAPLAAWLEEDRAKARAGLAKDAAGSRREATTGDFPFRPYDSSIKWAVVTDTPRFLSLSAETYDYTGGAHGNPGFRATLWDRRAGRRIDPTDVFTSSADLERILAAPMCRTVDAERAKRRGLPVVRGDDSFNSCPKVAEGTLILGSTNRRTIDRIGLLIGPYVAGPYAEGAYEITLPVTPALLAAVRRDYRDAFAIAR